MSEPDAPAAIPWYKSNAIRGLIVIVIASTLKHFKIADQFSQGEIATLADDALAIIGTLGVALVAHARVTQTSAPTLTLTRARASLLNQPPKDPSV